MKKTFLHTTALILSLALTMGVLTAVFSLPSGAVGGDEPSTGDEVYVPTGTVYYFDSDRGDDANDGLSPDAAFASFDAVKKLTLGPGDALLFNTDCVFDGSLVFDRVSGSAADPIIVGKYGDGERAVFVRTGVGTVLTIRDSAYIKVSDLEISAHEDGCRGVSVRSVKADTHDLSFDNLYIHDVSPENMDTYSGSAKASIGIYNDAGPDNCIYEIRISDCELADGSFGIIKSGREDANNGYKRDHHIYVDGCYIHDMWDDGITIGHVNYMKVTNCTVLRTCISSLYYTAATWMHHAEYCVVSDCEIGDSENYMDGMACDFDSDSHYSMYERIYSHDNCRFFWNVTREGENHDNTIRYCLSVNDCVTSNGGYRAKEPDYIHKAIYNFKFYNNTVVNTVNTNFIGPPGEDLLFPNLIFKNNIFIPTMYRKLYMPESADCTNNLFFGILAYYPTLDEFPDNIIDDPLLVNIYNVLTGEEFERDDFLPYEGSPVIGAGCQVEEDMGDHDIWGNPIGDTHNIGCYEGSGVKVYDPEETEEEDDDDTTASTAEKTEPSTKKPPVTSPTASSVDEKTEPAPGTATDPQTVTEPVSEPVSATEPTGIDVPLVNVLAGDADGDGKVTASDARTTLRVAVKLDRVDEALERALDLDGRDGVTAADARLVLRTAVGLESVFYIELRA